MANAPPPASPPGHDRHHQSGHSKPTRLPSPRSRTPDNPIVPQACQLCKRCGPFLGPWTGRLSGAGCPACPCGGEGQPSQKPHGPLPARHPEPACSDAGDEHEGHPPHTTHQLPQFSRRRPGSQASKALCPTLLPCTLRPPSRARPGPSGEKHPAQGLQRAPTGELLHGEERNGYALPRGSPPLLTRRWRSRGGGVRQPLLGIAPHQHQGHALQPQRPPPPRLHRRAGQSRGRARKRNRPAQAPTAERGWGWRRARSRGFHRGRPGARELPLWGGVLLPQAAAGSLSPSVSSGACGPSRRCLPCQPPSGAPVRAAALWLRVARSHVWAQFCDRPGIFSPPSRLIVALIWLSFFPAFAASAFPIRWGQGGGEDPFPVSCLLVSFFSEGSQEAAKANKGTLKSGLAREGNKKMESNVKNRHDPPFWALRKRAALFEAPRVYKALS